MDIFSFYSKKIKIMKHKILKYLIYLHKALTFLLYSQQISFIDEQIRN